MDAKAVQQLLTQIAVLLGGWTVIITALAAWISQIAIKRLFNAWDQRNQIEIDRIRHNQQQSEQILKDLGATLSASQSQMQLRRIEAVDRLWNEVVELRQHFARMIFFFDIIRPSEYAQVHTNPNTSAFFNFTQDDLLGWIEGTQSLDKYRPYLGETAWQQFFLYRSTLGRIGFLITEIATGETVDDWRGDGIIDANLKAVLGDDTSAMVGRQKSQAASLAVNLMESKILAEINNVLSGRQSSMEGLQNSIEVQQLIAKAAVETQQDYSLRATASKPSRKRG